ncbi:MAG: choice-of-anchor Q domain-containing protein, partial [Planctomycetaceae bacterium]
VSYTTISNNSVHLGDSVGGGVFTYSTADVNFVNVTIAENSAVKEAGGVYVFNTTTTAFTNSLIANNTANIRKDGFGSIHATHSLWRDASFNLLTDVNNQPGVDPELGPLSDNRAATRTHSLRPTSPAIDAGLASDALTDQRGRSLVDLPDVGGMIPDIGAYEVQSIGASTFQYSVYDQSQFGPGKALTYGFGFNDGSTGSAIASEPKFLGFEFDTGNLKAGHITGDKLRFGGEMNADFAGKFGFDVGFFINSGSMDIGFDGEHSYLIDESDDGATIASFIDVNDGSVYTVSPKVGAYADLVMQLDVGVSVTGCKLGCTSSNLVDFDLDKTIPLFSMNRQVTDFEGRPMFFAVGEVEIQNEIGDYVLATNADDVFSLSDDGTFFKITEDEDGNQSARAVQFVDLDGQPFDEPPIVPYLDGDIRYIGQGIAESVAKSVQLGKDSKLVKDILDARAERNEAANDVDRLKRERAKAETARDSADTAGDRITARGEVEALGKDIERAEDKLGRAEEKLQDAKNTAKKKTSFSAGLGVRFGQSEGSLLGGKADLVLGASAGSAGVGLGLGSVEVTLPDINLRSNTPDKFGVLRASTSSFADNSELDNKRQLANLQVDFAALTAPSLGIPAGRYSVDLGPLSANLTTVSYNLGPQLNVTQDVRVEPIVEKLTYTFHEIGFEEDLVENGITYPGGYQPGAARSVRVNIDGVPYNEGEPVDSVSFDPGQEVKILDSSPILVVPSLQMDSKVTNDIGLEVALKGSFEAFAMQLSGYGYDIIDVEPLVSHQHTLGTFDLGSVFQRTFELDSPQTLSMTPFTLFETPIDGKTERTAFPAEASGDSEFTMPANEYVFVRVDMFEAGSGTDGRDQYYEDIVITPGSGVTPDIVRPVDDRLTVQSTVGGGFRIKGFTADMVQQNQFLTFAIRSEIGGVGTLTINRDDAQDIEEETSVTDNTADFDETTVDIINASVVITTDIDDDGVSNAETDGVLFTRYIQGLRGSDLTAGALGPDAERTDPADIEHFIGETMSYTIQFDGEDFNSLDFNRSGTVDHADATVFTNYVSGEPLDADTIRFIEQARANTSYRDDEAFAEEIVQTTEDIYDFQSAFDITNAMIGSSSHSAYAVTPSGSVSDYNLDNWRRRIKYTEVYYQSKKSANLLSKAAIDNPADFGPARDELLALDADNNGISDLFEYGLPDDDLVHRTPRRRLGFQEPIYVQHRDGAGHDFKLRSGHLFDSVTIDLRVGGNLLLGDNFDVFVFRDGEWVFDVTINRKNHTLRDGLLQYEFDEPVERFRLFTRTLPIETSVSGPDGHAPVNLTRATGFIISKPRGVRGKPELRIKRLAGRGRLVRPDAIETETPHPTEELTGQQSISRDAEVVTVQSGTENLDFITSSTTALTIRGNDSTDDVLVLEGSGGPLAIPLHFDGGFRNDSIFVTGSNIALDFTDRDRLKGVELIDYRGEGANSLIIDYDVVRTNNEDKTLRVIRDEDDRFVRRGGWKRDGEQVENDIIFERWIQGDALLLLATL